MLLLTIRHQSIRQADLLKLVIPFVTAPGPPSSPSLIISTNVSLYLSWGEPEEPNGAIIRYNYTCYITDNENMVIQQGMGLTPDTMSAIIDGGSNGLAFYTNYTCEVTASTQPGEGAPAFASAVSAEAGELTGSSKLS